jgi:hypothetical protein
MPCDQLLSNKYALKWYFGKAIYPYQERKDRPYTQAEIAQIEDGTASIFFTGRFCYMDIFRAIHHTDFCQFWNTKKSGLGAGGDELCRYGNDAD